VLMSGKGRNAAKEGSIHDPDRKPRPTCRHKGCVIYHGQPRRGGASRREITRRGGVHPRPHGAIGGAETPDGANCSTHPLSHAARAAAERHARGG
jgi:hypothetical protein